MSGKVALITGASRGIGRAVAARLAREGYAVGINYHERKDKADELVTELTAAGCRAVAIQADVAVRAEVDAMVRRVEDELGAVTLLVSNAGVAGQALFQDVTDELWERYFAVNLNGARHAIQAVLPHMLHEHSGCIVTVSSIWGLHGASCEVTYSCTKHALIGLTRSLAMELAPSGIRVNCVAPGVIDTDMVQVLGQETLDDLARQTPLGRLGRPEEIAAAVAFLASDEAGFITGQVLTADGGFLP
ncbi:MAG: SDR family oxidoreductase [Oscillospiraceae bacterium]|nr:SDR family oxidoreductase [Oscillospiraceae bacterium]